MKNKLKKNFCAYFKVPVSNVNTSFTSIVGQFPINICKHYCCTYTILLPANEMVSVSDSKPACLSLASLYLKKILL